MQVLVDFEECKLVAIIILYYYYVFTPQYND